MSPITIIVAIALVLGLIYYGFKSYARSHPDAFRDVESEIGYGYTNSYEGLDEMMDNGHTHRENLARDKDESPENYLERLKEQRRYREIDR